MNKIVGCSGMSMPDYRWLYKKKNMGLSGSLQKRIQDGKMSVEESQQNQ